MEFPPEQIYWFCRHVSVARSSFVRTVDTLNYVRVYLNASYIILPCLSVFLVKLVKLRDQDDSLKGCYPHGRGGKHL